MCIRDRYSNYFKTRISRNTLGLFFNNRCGLFLCLIHNINANIKFYRNCDLYVVLHSVGWNGRFIDDSLVLLANTNAFPELNVTFHWSNWRRFTLYCHKGLSESHGLNACSVSIFSNYMGHNIWSSCIWRSTRWLDMAWNCHNNCKWSICMVTRATARKN